MSATVEIEQGRKGESEDRTKQVEINGIRKGASPGLKPSEIASANGEAEAVPLQNIGDETAGASTRTANDRAAVAQDDKSVVGCQFLVAGGARASGEGSQETHPNKTGLGRTAGRQESMIPTLSPKSGDKGGAPSLQETSEGRSIPHIPKEGICGPPTELEAERGEIELKDVPWVTPEQFDALLSMFENPPASRGPATAREKKLAKEKEEVALHVELMCLWGKLMRERRVVMVPFKEENREQKLPVREYLMHRLLHIRDKSGKLQDFRMNQVQQRYAHERSKKSIVLKARQLGITTYVAAQFFLNCITRQGTLCVQVAHDQRSAEEIFRIVHRMLANLPEWMSKGALKTSRANARQIVFPHMDSSYRVETASENAGRGLTVQCLHCSEVSRWQGDAAATLAALRAAVPPEGEIVLESTANGACGVFYEEWQKADEKGYSRHFYPWWWEPSYKRWGPKIKEYTEEEQELMEKFKLGPTQIAFRREVRANFGSRAAEEYAEDAESCFRASGECFFDLDMLERRMQQVNPAVEQTDNGRLLVFLPEQPGKEYIIGVDPAGGGSEGDYACAQVIDRGSGVQCAELRGHLYRYELAGRVASLARRYNMAEVAVETNNHGHDVLSHLSFYHRDVPVYEKKGHAGWNTTAASRPMMLNNLSAVAQAAPQLFNSPRLLEECKTFVRRPDGRAAAANGAHDDTVMAMAIAHAVRTEEAGKVRAPAVAVLEQQSASSN